MNRRLPLQELEGAGTGKIFGWRLSERRRLLFSLGESNGEEIRRFRKRGRNACSHLPSL